MKALSMLLIQNRLDRFPDPDFPIPMEGLEAQYGVMPDDLRFRAAFPIFHNPAVGRTEGRIEQAPANYGQRPQRPIPVIGILQGAYGFDVINRTSSDTIAFH